MDDGNGANLDQQDSTESEVVSFWDFQVRMRANYESYRRELNRSGTPYRQMEKFETWLMRRMYQVQFPSGEVKW